MDPMLLARLKSQYPTEMAQLKKDKASQTEIVKVLSLMQLETHIANAVETYCQTMDEADEVELCGGILTILHVFRIGIGQLFPELSEAEIEIINQDARSIACQIKKMPQE